MDAKQEGPAAGSDPVNSGAQPRQQRINRFARWPRTVELSNFGAHDGVVTSAAIEETVNEFVDDPAVALIREPIGRGQPYVKVTAPPGHPVWGRLGEVLGNLSSSDSTVRFLAELSAAHAAASTPAQHPGRYL